ncbi:MAG TPA: nuclease A inhibitor family protein [Oculatellaceae cyanobacterium]
MSIIEILKQASADLLMPSESEYPFEVFRWSGQNELTDQKLLELTGHPTDSPVETVALDYLFRNVAQEKEWHDEVQKANVSRFLFLVSTLEKNLTDIKVYRVGTIDIDVYIVGKNEGELVGLSTKVVET